MLLWIRAVMGCNGQKAQGQRLYSPHPLYLLVQNQVQPGHCGCVCLAELNDVSFPQCCGHFLLQLLTVSSAGRSKEEGVPAAYA